MKPGYEPRTLHAAAGWVVEELGEVLQVTGKILRFGPDGSNPDLPEAEREKNKDALRREITDLKLASLHLTTLGLKRLLGLEEP